MIFPAREVYDATKLLLCHPATITPEVDGIEYPSAECFSCCWVDNSLNRKCHLSAVPMREDILFEEGVKPAQRQRRSPYISEVSPVTRFKQARCRTDPAHLAILRVTDEVYETSYFQGVTLAHAVSCTL